MIRNLTSRRMASALNNAASASVGRGRNKSTMAVRSLAAGSSESSAMNNKMEDFSRNVRSSSPSPASRNYRPLSYQIQSPKASSSSRSYATSSPVLVEAAAASMTHECPIRHLQDSFYEPPLQALYDPHYNEDDHQLYTGYVASGSAVESTITMSAFEVAASDNGTTDGDMDVIADDEEWLPGVEAPAAEQVLAMMDTSYYHASYRAKSEERGQQQ